MEIQEISEFYSNPAEHLYPNELDLSLNILSIIDFQSPILCSNGINFNMNEIEISDEDDESSDEDGEYDASELSLED